MKKLLFFFLFIFSLTSFADSYMIYSISQDFPMGIPNEVLKKNYYVNIGSSQGVLPGTELNVYRLISRNNPFAKDKMERVNYKVKVGSLKVLHSETNHAIAALSKVDTEGNPMFFEVDSLMIGDHVNVKTE